MPGSRCSRLSALRRQDSGSQECGKGLPARLQDHRGYAGSRRLNSAQQGLLSVMRVAMAAAVGQPLPLSCAGRPVCQAPVHIPRQMWHCHRGQEESGECLTPTQLIQSIFVSLPSVPVQARFHFCATRVAILSAATFLCRSIFHAGQASRGSAGGPAAGKRLKEMRRAARTRHACFESTPRRGGSLPGLGVSLRKYLTETVQFLLRDSRRNPAPVRLFRGETA